MHLNYCLSAGISTVISVFCLNSINDLFLKSKKDEEMKFSLLDNLSLFLEF